MLQISDMITSLQASYNTFKATMAGSLMSNPYLEDDIELFELSTKIKLPILLRWYLTNVSSDTWLFGHSRYRINLSIRGTTKYNTSIQQDDIEKEWKDGDDIGEDLDIYEGTIDISQIFAVVVSGNTTGAVIEMANDNFLIHDLFTVLSRHNGQELF
jgi:hypothetical protein